MSSQTRPAEQAGGRQHSAVLTERLRGMVLGHGAVRAWRGGSTQQRERQQQQQPERQRKSEVWKRKAGGAVSSSVRPARVLGRNFTAPAVLQLALSRGRTRLALQRELDSLPKAEKEPVTARWARGIRKLLFVIRVNLSLKSYAPPAKENLLRFYLPDKKKTGSESEEVPRLAFDVKYFQPDTEFHLPGRAVDMCLKKPDRRTDEDLQCLMALTRGLSGFRMIPPEMQRTICRLMTYQRFGPGRVVIRKGHSAHALYFVFSGSAAISFEVAPDPHMIKQKVLAKAAKIPVIFRGDSVGEIALIKPNATRTASVVSLTDLELLVIERDDFLNFNMAGLWHEQRETRIEFLRTLKAFDGWTDANLNQISYRCRTLNFRYNQVIIADASHTDRIFFVITGCARLYKRLKREDCPEEYLDLFEVSPRLMDREWDGKYFEAPRSEDIDANTPGFENRWKEHCAEKYWKQEGNDMLLANEKLFKDQVDLRALEKEVRRYTQRTASPDQHLRRDPMRRRPESAFVSHVQDDEDRIIARVRSACVGQRRGTSSTWKTTPAATAIVPPTSLPTTPHKRSLTAGRPVSAVVRGGSRRSRAMSALSCASSSRGKPRREIFVKVDELRVGDSLGMEWINDFNQAKNLSLVSQGCDIMEVPLEEYIEHRPSVQNATKPRNPYPDNDELCKILYNNLLWSSYRHDALKKVPNLPDFTSYTIKPLV